MTKKLGKKPILVIFFAQGSLLSYPLRVPEYRESYYDFFRLASSYFSVFIARGLKAYSGRGGVFNRGYVWHRGVLQTWRQPIPARIIFNKDYFPYVSGISWTVINNPIMRRLNQKDVTHRLFQRYMKKYVVTHTRSDVRKAMQHLRGTMLVFKPTDTFGGEGVVITPRNTFLSSLTTYDGMVEEFIDTSEGIAGITPSYHDLRVTVMDGRIVQTYVRVPKKGSLLSNVAKGASLYEVPLRRLPRRVRSIVKAVDQRLSRYGHRVYSVDFGFEHGKPYLIEMNDQPGLPYKKWKQYYRRWHRSLLNVFINAEKELPRV